MRRLLISAMVLCALAVSLAGAQGQTVARFTFGTPGSITRAGFTKVTVQDAFTPEKGYGFQSTGDLLALDRGGATIERPADEYTASVYGAYRTTSDLTCAFVEGQSDNAFLVALPDGEYTVWLVASDAEEDPPLFQVWANGAKKLDVRIPRRAFVFMEPFRARATGGQLRLEFKSPHGWLLNGLVIAKDGPELDAVVAQADRDIFFLTEPELPNWKEVKAATNPPLALTPAEKQRGYVVFAADYTERIAPSYIPARAAVGQPLTAFATPGEFEPATFGVAASKDLGSVAVELSDLVGEKSQQRIPRQNVSLGVVRCRPVRYGDSGGKGTYEVVPQIIEPPVGRAIRVPAGQLKQWWLTVHVPPNTPAGRYRMAVTVRPEKAPPSVLEWRLLVLPFGLVRPADKHRGTWLESFPPVGGLRGPERRGRNTPAEVDRLVRADLADYRDHGFDLAIFNFYFGVKENPDGSFTYDLAQLAQTLDYWKTLGASTPVAIGCEYTFRNWEYRFAEPGKEHVAGTFSPKARQACVGLVKYIRDEAQRRGWPRLYFYPIDEPGNSKTENRMLFAENVLDFVHEVPGAQTATTVGASEVQRLGNRVDVRIYAYGSYSRNRVLQETKQGHPFWWYANGMFYGHSTEASRNMAGFELLRSGAEVASAWGFDCTCGNPHNDFDAGHRDWNVVFPGVDKLTPTIYWELCREGVDDCRYVATLQQEIRRAKKRGQTAAARRAEQVLAPLIDPDARSIDSALAFGRYRWRLAREIMSLRGDRQLALSFAALTNNPVGQEKLGPNLIADPSFEAGPQADGFPTAGYYITDPYSKPELKPVEALVVTDEIAHSGRYSLKWDFAKAEGKGFVYGRDHWLIVNVQVPPLAAQSLRGKRVRVGYWFRLGGGTAVPGMSLRQFGKGEFLGALQYSGGVEDPTVWNRFEAEDRLGSDFEGLDIHISCPIPSDPALAAKALFYLDDVHLQAIEEPPLTISTPLDEYYVGEAIPWSAIALQPNGQVTVALLSGGRVVAQQARPAQPGPLQGAFETRGLRPGIVSLQATLKGPSGAAATARRQLILAPSPFHWPARQ
jgi:hypothetical protein